MPARNRCPLGGRRAGRVAEHAVAGSPRPPRRTAAAAAARAIGAVSPASARSARTRGGFHVQQQRGLGPAGVRVTAGHAAGEPGDVAALLRSSGTAARRASRLPPWPLTTSSRPAQRPADRPQLHQHRRSAPRCRSTPSPGSPRARRWRRRPAPAPAAGPASRSDQPGGDGARPRWCRCPAAGADRAAPPSRAGRRAVGRSASSGDRAPARLTTPPSGPQPRASLPGPGPRRARPTPARARSRRSQAVADPVHRDALRHGGPRHAGPGGWRSRPSPPPGSPSVPVRWCSRVTSPPPVGRGRPPPAAPAPRSGRSRPRRPAGATARGPAWAPAPARPPARR